MVIITGYGVGIGYIAENYGWGATLGTFVVAALLGGLCVLTTWNKKPVTAACKVKG